MILALSPDSSSLCRLGSYKACKSVECNPTAGISFSFCPDSEHVSNTYFKQSTFPHCFKVPLSSYINFLDILHTNPWVFSSLNRSYLTINRFILLHISCRVSLLNIPTEIFSLCWVYRSTWKVNIFILNCLIQEQGMSVHLFRSSTLRNLKILSVEVLCILII